MPKRKYAPEVAEAAGTYKQNPQRRNEDAPRANGVAPEPPQELTPRARAKWYELCDDLRRLGILSSELRELLAAFVESYEGWRITRAIVERDGYVLANAAGSPIRNPACVDMHKYRDQLNRIIAELGLTPSARASLVANQLPEDDPFAEMLEELADQ